MVRASRSDPPPARGRRPWGLAPAEGAALLVFLALLLLPLWSFRYFPSQDGPIHLEIARLVGSLPQAGEASLERRYFALNPRPAPNLLIHWVANSWMEVLGPPAVEKLLLSTYVLLFVGALLFALRSVRPDGAGLVFLGLPLVFSFPLHMGFFNFCYSLPFYLFAVGAWLRLEERMAARQVLALAGMLLVVYFFHPVSLVMAGLTLGLLAAEGLVRELAERRTAGGISRQWLAAAARGCLTPLAAFVPSLGLLGLFLIDSEAVADDHRRLPPLTLAKHLLTGFSLVSFRRREMVVTTVLALLLLGAAAVAAWRRLRRGSRSPSDPLLAAAALAAAVYFAAPLSLAGGGYLNQRLQLYLFLGLVLWLAADPLGRRWRRPLQTAGGACTLALLALHAGTYQRLEGLLDEYLSCAPHLAPESTLLPLDYAPPTRLAGVETFKVRPFLHAAGYLAAAGGVVELTNYQAARGHFPVVYRPERDPFRHLGDELALEGQTHPIDLAAYERATDSRIDYVLLWGLSAERRRDADARDLLGQLAAGWERVWTSQPRGLGELYRRRGGPPGAAAGGAPGP